MLDILQYISNPWLYWPLAVVYITTIISVVVVILSENRNPVKTLAWVTVLVLLPLLGLVLYLFFGRSIKNKHMISRRKKRRLRRQGLQALHVALPKWLSAESRQQIRLARSLAGAPYYPGNEITLFTNGRDKFDSLLSDLRSARKYIHIQYYIISDDEIGSLIADTLIAKAREGVKVRVIYDHIGSIKTSGRFIKRLQREGVEIKPFFRVVFPLFATRINWRNHRKLCIIDGETGYIGGMNIADRYVDGPAPGKLWRDAHLRIKGPALAALQYSFALDWSFMGNGLLEEETKERPIAGAPGAGIQMLTSGPTSQWSEIETLFFKAIGNAKQRIYIQTPYFLPTDSLNKALHAAALAKIDVRLMMPMKSDSQILTAASFSYISECLKAGVKVYLFEAGMMHSKMLLVDDEMVSIGSTNFDFRSFEHNFEGNLFIYSKEFNAQAAAAFRADMKLSQRLTLAEWRRRPFTLKVVESLVRLLSPVL